MLLSSLLLLVYLLLLLHVPINFYRVLTLAVVPAKASVHSLCRYYSLALRHCWNVPFAVDPAVDEVLAVVGVFLLSSCLSWRPCCSWGPLLLLGSPAVAGVSCCCRASLLLLASLLLIESLLLWRLPSVPGALLLLEVAGKIDECTKICLQRRAVRHERAFSNEGR